MCFHCVFATETKTKKKKKPTTDRNESLNYFGSSEKQVCLPVSANRNTNESANVYGVTGAEQTHSGGNVASWFSDADVDSQTETSGTRCSSLLCPSVRLPVCLSPPSVHSQLSPLHGQNLNLAANQNNVLGFFFLRILFTF